ncbi:nitrous oxide reductase accessory protein NosL [Natronorubrum sp. DTA28]|uniref:nitrous oxide reductase accessory protein NosL n=1 Tax=Natronorubrum sp. DTA28 TaxID=3447019 RepID=UPI003F87D98B
MTAANSIARPHPTRRRILLSTGTLATAALAGCLGSGGPDDEAAEPVDLTEGQECDVCGMTIADHFGPAGQVFYADGEPEDRDGPARFDSVAELLVFHAEREARGWEKRATFVTDYSSVEYDLLEGDDRLHISTHAAAEDFADATELHYVADSEVHGAMGEDFLPFSDREEAEAFAEEYGGEVLGWGELS